MSLCGTVKVDWGRTRDDCRREEREAAALPTAKDEVGGRVKGPAAAVFVLLTDLGTNEALPTPPMEAAAAAAARTDDAGGGGLPAAEKVASSPS